MTKAYVQEYLPELICQSDGEEKLRILCVYRRISKGKLGFLIKEPKMSIYRALSAYGFDVAFQASVIITPKPGLFPIRK